MPKHYASTCSRGYTVVISPENTSSNKVLIKFSLGNIVVNTVAVIK